MRHVTIEVEFDALDETDAELVFSYLSDSIHGVEWIENQTVSSRSEPVGP